MKIKKLNKYEELQRAIAENDIGDGTSCDKCKIRIGYARVFDVHFWASDCPYVCPVQMNKQGVSK